MSMRQKMAGLLAAFMLATAIFPSHAAGNVSHDSVSGGNAERLASLSANGLERDWNPEGDLGQVDVTVGAALILEKPVTFTISLTGAGTKAGAGEKQLTLGADNRRESRVRFERLAPGDYTLRVKAPGFADYTQEITVNNKAYTVTLLTGFLGNMVYETENAHPGVLLIGDVNGDGIADQADRTRLVDAIDQDSKAGGLDLNGDDQVNLVDLEYFAKGQKKAEDTRSRLEVSVPAAAIYASPVAGTQVAGKGETAEKVLKALM